MRKTALEMVEDRICREQYAWIHSECGAEAAEKANYGWGVDAYGPEISVSTKVYGHGVLTSNASPGSNVSHLWRPF